MSGTHLDGNELAGPLREVFAADMTSAQGVCAGCGQRAVIAAARVYASAAGQVARCAGCEGVLLRLVRGPDRVWLDLRGLASLEIAVPS